MQLNKPNKTFQVRNLYMYVYMHVWSYPTPPLWARCNTRSIFKQSTVGLTLDIFFSSTDCLIKAKESSPPYYSSVAEQERDGFTSFLKALTWTEMQTLLFRIWTQVNDSISCENNHYIM